MDSNLWYNLLASLLTILASTAIGFLAKWLKSKYSAEALDTAQSVAETVVHAVEQIGNTLKWDGPTKFVQAVAYFAELAGKFGISLNETQIKSLIEAQVAYLNQVWKNLSKPEPSPIVSP